MTTNEIISIIILLLAGIGVFLVGVSLLSSNIEQLANTGIKKLFKRTANNKLINIGIGATTTAIIQSSGVTTVLIVGFVNVGIMTLYQATSMIMGANIGTTITAHLASLQQFDFTQYIKAFAFIGIMMTMIWKKDSIKKVGYILAGLGMVFIGLEVMKSSMESMQSQLETLFLTIDNPFLLFFVGIVVTALAQSSSATTSVIITLATVPGFVFGNGGNSVLYMILGTNIGSCVTAIMSSFGANANAKRASLIHFLFNTFGSIIFFILFLAVPTFMDATFGKWFAGNYATQIAMFHTFFNVACTLMFMPFTNVFVKVSTLLIKDKKEQVRKTNLDDRLLASPTLAIEQIEKESIVLADVAMNAFKTSYKAFREKSKSLFQNAQTDIEEANALNKFITNYLVKISATCSKNEEEKRISDIYNNLGDIMRIAEIADNFGKYTTREVDDNLEFSPDILNKVDEMVGHIETLYDYTKTAILEHKVEILQKIDDTESIIDDMRKSLIDEHIDRLNSGKCRPENSAVFINLVSNLERLGDHLTYIAHTIQ